MREHPEAMDIINQYHVTEGRLSLTEIENMENWKFGAWLTCKKAGAVAKQTTDFKNKANFKSRRSA